MVWLSGVIPQAKRLLVQFPVRAHVWVSGQVPCRRRVRGNLSISHTDDPLPLFLFSFPLSKNENK